MAIQVDIVSTRQGMHALLIGMDSNELADFQIMVWLTKFHPRPVDVTQAMGLNWISFMGGDLWIHNDENQDRCNLFGEKRDCVVGVITNESPMQIKVLDSMGVHSDSTWEITSITLPATINHPDGMSSKIPSEQFKRRGGIWRAKFLRNMKSTSDTASVLEAIQGEPLRGAEAHIVMKNTSNSQVKLFEVTIEMTTSRV